MKCSRRLFQAFTLLLATASSIPIGLAQGGSDEVLPPVEWEKRQDIQQRMEPLGDDLLGDMIDPHTGSISFEMTDVSLPGNSGLEVAIKRRRTPGEIYEDGSRIGFGDWQVQAPSIKVELLSAVWASNRCSGSPGTVYPAVDNNPHAINRPTYAMEYSNGIQLTAPDGGGNLLWVGPDQSNVYGAGVTYATEGHWRFTCISNIGSANGGGEGFIGVAPNGNEYRFDRLVQRQGADMVSFLTATANNRITAWLMATEVKDVNGNWVRYNYDALDRLTSITSNDGRTISLNYFNSDGSTTNPERNGSLLIQSVTANGRTWNYAYGDAAYTEDTLGAVVRPHSLKTVTLPNGLTWQYELGGMSARTYPSAICNQHWQDLEVWHPHGVKGEFQTWETNHRMTLTKYQSELTRGCDPFGVSSPNSRQDITDHSEIMSVRIKRLRAPDNTTRSWLFAYEEDVSGTSFRNPPGDHTNLTRIIEPEGVVKVYYHYWEDEPFGGKLKNMVVLENDVEIESTEYVYEQGQYFFGTDYLSSPLTVPLGVTRHFDEVEKDVIVSRGTDTFLTNRTTELDRSSALFAFGKPSQIDTSSSLNANVRTTQIEYEHNKTEWRVGLTKKVTKNARVIDEYVYDSLGRLQQALKFGRVMQSFTYHSDGNIATITDALGQVRSASSWKRGLPQTVDRPDGTQFNRVVDDNGWVTSETNGRQNTTAFSYNNMGWLTAVNPPGSFWADTSISYAYATDGVVQTTTRGDDRAITTYDVYNRPVLERRQDLSGAAADIYTKFIYDAQSRTTFASFPSANSDPADGIETDYDVLDRITETRRMVGGAVLSRTQTAYLSGNRIQVTDPRNNVTTTTFESYGAPVSDPSSENAQPILIVPPLGAQTEIDYDIWGNPTHERRVSGSTVLAQTVTSYNLRLLPDSVTDPAQDITYTYYNNKDLPIVEIDGAGRKSRIVYDSMDRVEKVIKAWTGSNAGSGELDCAVMRNNYNPTTGYLQQCYQQNGYDANGNLDWVSDAKGNTTTYTYNDLDLPLRANYPDASYTEVQAYDALGNPTTTRTRAGQIHTSRYDAFGRMIAMRTPDRDTAYAFDAQDLRTCASVFNSGTLNLNGTINCAGTTTNRQHRTLYSFDGAGRLLSETSLQAGMSALPTSYQYDAADNRTRITWPDTYFAQYEYNALARLTNIRENGSAILAHYDYDAQSRLDAITHGGNNYGGGSGASYTDFTWEIDSDLGGLSYSFASSPNVSFTYGYDGSGKLISQDASVSGWLYAPSGSRTDAFAPANALNQYTSVRGLAVTHDLNGNRTAYDGLSTPHDSENRMTGASGSGLSAAYSYDAAGRRVAKTVNSAVTHFAHAGNMEIAEYNGATLLRRYVPGHSVDMRAAMVEANGTKHYYHANRLGSVQAVVSETGAVTDQYVYTPFGVEEPLTSTGNPFRYTGRRFDAETGLYHYRARYYDPAHGRFLQTDPIGYEDQMNMYAYVANDPLNATDPTGKCSEQNSGSTILCAIEDAITDFLEPHVEDAMESAGVEVVPEGERDPDGILDHEADPNTPLEEAGEIGKRVAEEGVARLIPTRKLNRRRCCFVAGTLVDTDSGLRAIEDIMVGDKVWARDVESGDTVLQAVTDLIRVHRRAIWEVSFSINGGGSEVFETTDDHPWWVDGLGWKTTEELKEGMPIVTRGGRAVMVSSVRKMSRTDATYNITVENYSTYFVGKNKILVHNCPSDSSKNERHGDGGRRMKSSEEQIADLEAQLAQATSRREKVKLKTKIRNVREAAARAQRGEEHSTRKKR